MPLADTGSGLGPGPGLIIFGANGLILDVNYGSAPQKNGSCFGNPTASPALPGGSFQAKGSGEIVLFPNQISGLQGTMEVAFTVGAAGASSGIAFISDGTHVIGIALDSSNAPYVIVTDVSGNVKSTGAGDSAPSGTNVVVNLTWDSRNPLSTGLYAFARVGERTLSWNVDPGSPWTAFSPTKVLLGTALPAPYNLGIFNGSITRLQVSNVPTVVIAPGESVVNTITSSMVANSSMAANATVTYYLNAAPGGNATVSATATKVP
jgi:hypothetical protein